MSIPLQALWQPSLLDPSAQRQSKPRTTGITMVIDKGLGLHETEDLCLTASPYIDYLKLGFGTMVLYPRVVLERKLALFKEAGLTSYPGGTFFEIALNQNQIHQYVRTLQHLGITTVEISDGTIEITLHERRKWIKRLINEGFHVITEYGKKLAGSQIELAQLFETIDSDLECGAQYIIIEGRESGADVGLYNADGETDTDILNTILSHPYAHRLIWEAPQKQQQVDILRSVGCRANLGNIAPQDIYGTESLRRGLRSDTFFFSQGEVLRRPEDQIR